MPAKASKIVAVSVKLFINTGLNFSVISLIFLEHRASQLGVTD